MEVAMDNPVQAGKVPFHKSKHSNGDGPGGRSG